MLLLDRLIEHGWHFQRKNPDKWREVDATLFHALGVVPAYELSSVLPLFNDWNRELDKKVPRKAPFPVLWCEWCREEPLEDSYKMTFSVGSLIVASKTIEKGKIPSPCYDSPEDKIDASEETYECTVFIRMNDTNDPSLKPFNGSIYHVDRVSSFFLSNNLQSISGLIGATTDRTQGYLGLPCVKGFKGAQLYAPWPAFMAFALLNCKNIMAEDNVPDERTQRRVAKAGNPPRVTYKTLKIEVPSTVQRCGVYEGDEEDTGPKVRFHLCSGHFKHLTSERYKEKRGQWIWCPAHWKGSKELGEVHKRYRLEASK